MKTKSLLQMQSNIVLVGKRCLVAIVCNHRFYGQWDTIWLEELGLYSLLHFSTQLYFVLICLSLACFTISVVHNCTLFDLLVISLFCNKYLLFYFLLYFIFCRWNLFPMATFHLGLILPLVAVCECFRCSSLFSLSYVIGSLLFLFPFSSVQLCSFKK
jgi:hypothetical protein